MSTKIDITGQRFGRLVAIKPTIKRTRQRYVVWECQCDCGEIVEKCGHCVKRNLIRSCGCLQMDIRKENGKKGTKCLTGKRFGRLTAIKPTLNRISRSVAWKCICDCGSIVLIGVDKLSNGVSEGYIRPSSSISYLLSV